MKDFFARIKWVFWPPIIGAYCYAILLRIQGVKCRRIHSESEIPPGPYCYTLGERDPNDYFPHRFRCPYLAYNRWAYEQENGYCHFIKEGDWQYKGTFLLWDMCKECGIKTEEEGEES